MTEADRVGSTTLLSTIIRARAALNTYIWASPARRPLCEADVALSVALAAERDCNHARVAQYLVKAMYLAARALPTDHPALRLILAAYDEVDDQNWVFGEGDIISVDSWAVSA